MAPATDVVRLDSYDLLLLRAAVRVNVSNLKHPARGDLLRILTLLESATGASLRIPSSTRAPERPRHVRRDRWGLR